MKRAVDDRSEDINTSFLQGQTESTAGTREVRLKVSEPVPRP